jgi:hypothetical protein
MSPPSDLSAKLVPAGQSSLPSQLPAILSRAGKAAIFATEEFFYRRIRNEHTRQAYLIAVKRFWRGPKPAAWSSGASRPRTWASTWTDSEMRVHPWPRANSTWPPSVITSTAW